VAALGRAGDVLIGLSTSGRSRNVVRAFETARALGMRTVALLGGDGGTLAPLADVPITVPSADTQRIQETHLALVHLLCELVEARVSAGEWAAPRSIWEDPERARERAMRRAA